MTTIPEPPAPGNAPDWSPPPPPESAAAQFEKVNGPPKSLA